MEADTARLVAIFMLQGIFPFSFKERARTRLKRSVRHETDPERFKRR